MDYIIITLINILLLLHTPPTTHMGAFFQGVSIGVVYMFTKHLIIEENDRARNY